MEQIREEALLSDEEMEACYQKEYKKALEFSEKYETSLSRRNFNPNRPADRQRSFDVTHREQVMKAIAQAQLDKVLKDKRLRIECENQGLPENPDAIKLDSPLAYMEYSDEDRAQHFAYKQAQQDMLTPKDNEVWIKCKVKEEQ